MQRWKDPTGEDEDRTRRRQAELLVYDKVPLDLIAYVACCTTAALQVAYESLRDVGGTRHYGVDANMFMT
jgi:hypothetical protein